MDVTLRLPAAWAPKIVNILAQQVYTILEDAMVLLGSSKYMAHFASMAVYVGHSETHPGLL